MVDQPRQETSKQDEDVFRKPTGPARRTRGRDSSSHTSRTHSTSRLASPSPYRYSTAQGYGQFDEMVRGATQELANLRAKYAVLLEQREQQKKEISHLQRREREECGAAARLRRKLEDKQRKVDAAKALTDKVLRDAEKLQSHVESVKKTFFKVVKKLHEEKSLEYVLMDEQLRRLDGGFKACTLKLERALATEQRKSEEVQGKLQKTKDMIKAVDGKIVEYQETKGRIHIEHQEKLRVIHKEHEDKINRMKETLAQLFADRDAKFNQVEEMMTRADDLVKEKKALEENAGKLQEENNKAVQELSSLNMKIEVTEKIIKGREEQLKEMIEQKTFMEREIAELDEKKKELSTHLEAHKEENLKKIDYLTASLNSLKETLSESKRNAASMEEAISKKKIKISELQTVLAKQTEEQPKKLQEMEAEKLAVLHKTEQLEKMTIPQLETKLTSLTHHRDGLKEKVEGIIKIHAKKVEERENLEKTLLNLEKGVKEMQLDKEKNHSQDPKLKELNKDYEKECLKNTNLKQRLEQLKKEKERYESLLKPICGSHAVEEVVSKIRQEFPSTSNAVSNGSTSTTPANGRVEPSTAAPRRQSARRGRGRRGIQAILSSRKDNPSPTPRTQRRFDDNDDHDSSETEIDSDSDCEIVGGREPVEDSWF